MDVLKIQCVDIKKLSISHVLMDIKDIIKLQFVSGMANNQAGLGGGPQDSGGSTSDKIFNIVCQALLMFAIGFADEISKQIPIFLDIFKTRVMAKFSAATLTQSLDSLRQTPISDNAVPLNKRHFNNTVNMSRS